MNIKQMQSAIKSFRAADVSLIEDEKLRAKAQKLQSKQGGFTLLELLVVITLLATLSTAALVAYEGVGENAEDAASANNILAAESSIRNYRAVESVYPNQWDNLANLGGETTGGAATLLAPETSAFFGQLVINSDDTILDDIAGSLNAVGIDELQTLVTAATFANTSVPNLSFNESAPGVSTPASELELTATANVTGTFAAYDETDVAALTPIAMSIVPSDTGDGTTAGGCTVNSIDISTAFDTTDMLDNSRLNLINDAMGNDECHLVMAFGFGKDVPGTTIESRVAIGQAPTAGTQNVNPATNYARYIALFQVGADGSDGSTPDGDISAAEIFPRARLIGVVDPEGRTLDAAIAGANQGA